MRTPRTDPVVQPADDSVARVAESVALVHEQCTEILGQMKAMNDRLSQLTERESEFRTLLERDADLDPHMDTLLKVLKRDTAGEAATAIERATLKLEPFPYQPVA